MSNADERFQRALEASQAPVPPWRREVLRREEADRRRRERQRIAQRAKPGAKKHQDDSISHSELGLAGIVDPEDEDALLAAALAESLELSSVPSSVDAAAAATRSRSPPLMPAVVTAPNNLTLSDDDVPLSLEDQRAIERGCNDAMI
jgi:hypothetical protein